MIQIDMEMPSNCFNCKLSFAYHCSATGLPITIPNTNCVLEHPPWCPLKDAGSGASQNTMTNADIIQNMSNEGLAMFIRMVYLAGRDDNGFSMFDYNIEEWLKKETLNAKEFKITNITPIKEDI